MDAQVCPECDYGLFKVDITNGLIILICASCDSQYRVYYGMITPHLKSV